MNINSEKLYAGRADDLPQFENEDWWHAGRRYWTMEFIKRAKQVVPDSKNITYADLGCGTGVFAKAIRDAFEIKQTILVENHPEVTEFLKPEEGVLNLNLDLEKPFSLPFAPSLVTCMDVIEHIRDDVQFLMRVRKVMAPAGVLMISVPAHPLLYSEWDRHVGHFRRYSKRALSETLEESGFELAQATYMWSLLIPAALYRRMAGAHFKWKVGHHRPPPALNALLAGYAKLECNVSQWLPIPFGSSLIASARRIS